MLTAKFTIPAGHKIGDCAAKDQQRYSLMTSVVALPGEQTYLAASDSRILAVLPVESEVKPEKPMFLPPKGCNANGKPLSVEVNGELRANNGKDTKIHAMPEQEGRFPPIQQIFPQGIGDYIPIALDVNLLADLAKAISPSGRVMLFIKPQHSDDLKGVSPCDVVAVKPLVAVGMDENNEYAMSGIGLIVPLAHKHVSTVRDYVAKHVANMPKDCVTVSK